MKKLVLIKACAAILALCGMGQAGATDQLKTQDRLHMEDKDMVRDQDQLRDRDKDMARDQDQLRDRDKDMARDQDQLQDRDKDVVRDQDQMRDRDRDQIYLGTLMTSEERSAYMERLRLAKTEQERARIREQHRIEMDARAKERGISRPSEGQGSSGNSSNSGTSGSGSAGNQGSNANSPNKGKQ